MVIEKSPHAFRTISEASEILSLPSHVLRFWESKFKQIKPLKRAGGRRFYRPNDILFIMGIKTLLHGEGLTINGVKRLIKEKGTNFIVNRGIDVNSKIDNSKIIKVDSKVRKNQNTKIEKEKINELVKRLIFFKSKIESRFLNDF